MAPDELIFNTIIKYYKSYFGYDTTLQEKLDYPEFPVCKVQMNFSPPKPKGWPMHEITYGEDNRRGCLLIQYDQEGVILNCILSGKRGQVGCSNDIARYHIVYHRHHTIKLQLGTIPERYPAL